MIDPKFKISSSAQKIISHKGLDKFFMLNEDSQDVLTGNKIDTLSFDLNKPIKDFIRLDIPENLWIPNFGKSIMDLVNDSQVFILTEDDIKSNPEIDVVNRFTNKPATLKLQNYFSATHIPNKKELAEELKSKADKRNEVISKIYRFLMQSWWCLEKDETEKQQLNPNALTRLKEVLMELIQYTLVTSIQKDVENLFHAVNTILSEGIYPKFHDLRPMELRKKLKTVSSDESDYRHNNDGDANRKLMRLIEEVLPVIKNNKPLRLLEEEAEIAKRNFWGDFYKTKMDWLGCYCSETGTIFLKIDRIVSFYETLLSSISSMSLEFVIQKVILHEFIHAYFDLYPRDSKGNVIFNSSPWEKYGYNEESLDNACVLRIYQGTPEFLNASSLISYQPYFYNRGLDLFKEHPASFIHLLRNLAEYKMYGGEKRISVKKGITEKEDTSMTVDITSPKKSWEIKVKYIANMFYAIFALIIMKEKMTLADVINLNHSFLKKHKQLWLIDEKEYLEKIKGDSPFYYSIPLITSDEKKVYVSYQWRAKDISIMEKIMENYPHIFG